MPQSRPPHHPPQQPDTAQQQQIGKPSSSVQQQSPKPGTFPQPKPHSGVTSSTLSSPSPKPVAGVGQHPVIMHSPTGMHKIQQAPPPSSKPHQHQQPTSVYRTAGEVSYEFPIEGYFTFGS